MDARLRHATQPQHRLMGSPLTAPGEGLQAYLHPRVRRLQPPIPQRFEVLGAQMERAPDQGLLLGWSVPSSGILSPKTLQTSLSEARAEYITHKEQNRIAALPVEAVTAPITEAQLGRVEASLKEAPPVKFDVARQVRVFESYLQYVELSLTGAAIQRHRLAIPRGNVSNMLLAFSYQHAEFIAIDQEPDHDIMQLNRFGKTDGFAH